MKCGALACEYTLHAFGKHLSTRFGAAAAVAAAGWLAECRLGQLRREIRGPCTPKIRATSGGVMCTGTERPPEHDFV